MKIINETKDGRHFEIENFEKLGTLIVTRYWATNDITKFSIANRMKAQVYSTSVKDSDFKEWAIKTAKKLVKDEKNFY